MGSLVPLGDHLARISRVGSTLAAKCTPTTIPPVPGIYMFGYLQTTMFLITDRIHRETWQIPPLDATNGILGFLEVLQGSVS